MGRLDGKVAVISGAARGQGRSHAVTLAREGASIVAFDVCEGFETVLTPPATEAELEETAKLVEEQDQRCLAVKADARDLPAWRRSPTALWPSSGRSTYWLPTTGFGLLPRTPGR